MRLLPQTPAWFDRLATLQDGYRYPWRSTNPWHALLPEPLQWKAAPNPDWARSAVEQRLAVGGLSLHSWWSCDVPEVFPDPEQLYAWRTWGCVVDEVPPLQEVRPILERVFAEHGTAEGAAIRHRRYIWKAVVSR
jgi:hypothetical protein